MEKTDEEIKIMLLAEELGEKSDDIEVSTYDESVFVVGTHEYLVLCDHELEIRLEEELERYLDEVVLLEIPEPYRWYFDDKKWMSDARMDGAAHILGTYDGEEISCKYEDEWYFIYRIN